VILWLRSLLFYLFGFTSVTIFASVIILLIPFTGASARYKIGVAWCRMIQRALSVLCGIDSQMKGLENIPQDPNKPLIVLGKHQSAWETFALIMLFDDFCYILKRELTFIPLFGWYLWKSDQIAINRSTGSSALAQAEEKARKIFAEGRQLFIFPEGTRRPAGAPPKYKFGVAHLYDACHVPCLPIVLNSGLFWARRSLIKRPGTIVVEVLPPIAPGIEKQEFFALLQNRMESASENLIAEAVARDPSLIPIIERNRQLP
jgi:1-acyl-sn-glycerol-3-phosphate acyltransferase